MARQINVTGKIQGRLIITPPVNGEMLIQRENTLIGDDALLNEVPLRVLDRTITFAQLPQNVRDALITMDSWTSSEIDTVEGL